MTGELFKTNPGEDLQQWEVDGRREPDDLHRARLGGEGILTDADLPALTAGVKRVFHLMRDGEWHDASAIRLAAGSGVREASEGLRRLRELKQKLPQTWTVDRRKKSGRMFEYKIGRVSE